jgi:4-diphosphocytidyl-2C-methyl-D-erythritol kinase
MFGTSTAYEEIDTSRVRSRSNTVEAAAVMMMIKVRKKEKVSRQQAVKAHRVMGGRGSHIFYTIRSQMPLRLSAFRAERPLPPGKIPGTHFC